MIVRAFDITFKDEAIQTVDLKAGTWTFQAFVNADTYTIGLKDTLGVWHNYDLSDQTGTGWYDVEETFTTDFDAVELSLLNNVGTAQVLFPMIEKGARRSVKRPNDLDIEEAAIIKSASWEIHTSSPVIYKDAPDLTTDGVHTPVTVTGRHWVGSTMTEEGFITVTANDATEALTASPSPVTIAPANNADKHTYTIRLYSDANKTELLDWETIPVVFKGAKGISAIRLHINNPVDVLPADSAGNVLNFDGTGTSIHVFEGAVELDYNGTGAANGTFKVEAAPTNITMGAITDSGNVCVVADATAMPVSDEKASIVYTITGKTLDGFDFTIVGEQNFTKTKMGVDGASATYWSIKSSSPVIYKNAVNATTSGAHTPVTVSGELVIGATTSFGGFITVTPNGGTEPSTASASPVTIAPAAGDGKTSYTVRLYDTASKTTLLDTMTIPVVFKGASGVNAINVILSNEADVLPASSTGVVSDYSGSGTNIRVFEGSTELDYDGVGTANGKFNVTAAATGITAGAKSDSGLTCVFANASNMTADNASITFTITGKTAVGTAFSFTKVQSFAKSKTGLSGVSVTLVDVEFAKNTTPTTPPTTGWSTTSPVLAEGEQLWTRTKTTYSTGSPTYTTPANITPKTGQGVDSITEEFAISTSKTVQPTTGWSTTQPAWISGQYIWSRVKVVYKNPVSTVYIGYSVSSEWEAINDIQIGGRNYVLNSQSKVRKAGSTNSAFINLYADLEKNTEYTVSLNATLVAGTATSFSIVLYNEAQGVWIPVTRPLNGSRVQWTFTTPSYNVKYSLLVYAGISEATANNTVRFDNIKLEKGNKATDWSPAPEDPQERNLFKSGKVNISTTTNPVAFFNWLSEDIPAGTKVSISVRAKASVAADNFMQYFNESDGYVPFSDPNLTTGWKVFTLTRVLASDLIASPSNTTFHLTRNVSSQIDIDWICVVIGDKAPLSFIYAPGDIQKEIDTAATSTRTEYYRSTSSTSQTGGSWSTTVPVWVTNTYIWERIVTNRSNGTVLVGTPYLSQTWENINQLKADVIEEQAKTQYQTTTTGGLIYTALMKLFDGVTETAGISGLQGTNQDNPSFWSGGSNAQAFGLIEFLYNMSLGTPAGTGTGQFDYATKYAALAKITMLHNGAGKYGDFIVLENGVIVIIDPATGQQRVMFSVQDLPSLTTLLSTTNLSGYKDYPSVTADGELGTGLDVTEDSSTIVFGTQSGSGAVPFNLSADYAPGTPYCRIIGHLDLMKDGVFYKSLGVVSIDNDVTSNSSPIYKKTFTNCPKGLYTVVKSKEWELVDGVTNVSFPVGASRLSWSFTQANVRRFQFGRNGFMAFYSLMHLYLSETTGLDIKGATNMPGVLLSATVSYSGGWGSVWGAKKSDTAAQKDSTGHYTVYHNVGHTNYQIYASAHTASRSHHIVSKGTTNFVIEWRTIGSSPALVDTAFDCQIVGNNYNPA